MNPNRIELGATIMAAAALVFAAPGCTGNELKGPEAEVQETNVKLDLPAVPEFQTPSANPDGSHPVAEMRLKGKKFLDTEVKVKGYVIWIYDCATAIRTPEMSEKDLKKILENEPERCSRPNIYLGDKPDTPTDKGIWAVEVPRPPRKDEEKALPDDMLAEMKAAWEALPEFKVGDEIAVTGTWALASPRGFRNSDGLLVYKAMENLTAPAEEKK